MEEKPHTPQFADLLLRSFVLLVVFILMHGVALNKTLLHTAVCKGKLLGYGRSRIRHSMLVQQLHWITRSLRYKQL